MVTLEIQACDWCYEAETDVVEPTHFYLLYGKHHIDLCDDCFKIYEAEMKEKEGNKK